MLWIEGVQTSRICVLNWHDVTRPELEPGICGSGGSRLFHEANKLSFRSEVL